MMRTLRISVAVIAPVLLAACDKVFFGEDTKFAAGFREARFRQIQPGNTEQQVLSLLGRPLLQSTQDWSEVWSYWPGVTQPGGTRSSNRATVYDLFGRVTHLGFSPTGTVTRASGDYLHAEVLRLTKQQLLSEFGEPNRREIRRFEVISYYTAAGKSGSGTYKRREVHYDANGTVISTVSETHYD